VGSGLLLTSLLKSDGFLMFTFIVSIPYYTVKKVGQLRDNRHWLNGHFLRETVSFPVINMLGQADEAVGELQEAQTTIALTGIDQGRWTVIRLVDSIRTSTSFRDYDPEAEPEGVQAEDIITGKNLSTDDTCTIDPRLYFLWAWKASIEEAFSEWDEILECVKQTVKWCVKFTCTTTPPRSANNTRMQHYDSSVLARRGPQSHQTARRLHQSIFRKSELTSLLIILKLRLVETATAWMKFQSGDIKYFRGQHPIEPGPPGGRNGTLQAVEEVYKRLQLKLVELEGHITELKHNYVSAICCHPNVSAS